MSRRQMGNRGLSGSGGSVEIPDAPLLLEAFAAYRGDVTDTATNFDWTDRTGNDHTLREATALNKPTIVTPSEIGGMQALRGDGTNTRLVSIDGTSVYNFLNQGPAESHAVIIPRGALTAGRYIYDTQNANPCFAALFGGGTSNQLRTLNFNNAGGAVYDVLAANAFSLNTPVRISHVYRGDTGVTPEYASRINNVVGQSGDAGAPGTNNAGALHLFQRGNGTARAQIDFAELVLFDRELTDIERNVLDAYFIARYGFLA